MNHLRAALLMMSVAGLLSACGVEQPGVDGQDTQDAVDTNAGTADGELAALSGKIERFVGRDGKTYFHVLAANGERVLQSQGYTSDRSAETGIASVKTNGIDATRYQQRVASDGSVYFVLKAGNGAVIGISQMYATAYDATRGAAAVVKVISNIVSDETAKGGAVQIETFKGLDSKYYFHLKSGNGEIVMQSQGYTSLASATNGAVSVQKNGADSRMYTVLPAADGSYFFHLKAANGAIIGRGETYATQEGAKAGVTTCVELISGKATR